MRYMIHQVGGDKQDFIEWWKLSSTFDNEITRETKIFDSKPNPDYNSGIGFLRKFSSRFLQNTKFAFERLLPPEFWDD
jgi:hypothetical protein